MVQFLDDAPASPSAPHDDSPATSTAAAPNELSLHLLVRDPEVLAELSQRGEGRERDEFALTALRLGVIALRHATGTIDAGALRNEADKMIQEVDKLVSSTVGELATRVSGELASYFDPASGKLSERLNRLVQKDGELAQVLGRHLDGDTSLLARTLTEHVGSNSPLMQLLSPEQKNGLLARIEKLIADSLKSQQERIVAQFSLNDPMSALSQLLKQISDKNGALREDLSKDVEKVRQEFTLDNPDGALRKLVGQVEAANNQIKQQMSLDNEQSAISQINRQIKGLIEQSDKFHAEVRKTLAVLEARRQAEARGTAHGTEFERIVHETICPMCQPAGDVVEFTGNTVGSKPNCKKGDIVLALGPESAAPGARVAIECKEDAKYNEIKALEELAEARPNRDAQVGVFVFSKQTAPATQPTLRRIGNDVLCVWNKEDPSTDVVLLAALSIARALVIRQRVQDQEKSQELLEIEDAVNRIEKTVGKAEDVETWANTIVKNGAKIAESAKSIRELLVKQIERLRDALSEMKKDDSSG
jgi:hypothetical protein